MPTSETPPTDPVERLLDAARTIVGGVGAVWRRALSAVARALLAWGRRIGIRIRGWYARTRSARDYFLDPRAAWQREDGAAISAAAAIGVRGFAAGLLLGAALDIATTGSWRGAVVLIAIETVWALARIAIIAALVPRAALPGTKLIAAYTAGLAPFVFAATGLLRVAALVASALLTFRGLTAAGLPGRAARGAVALAFGGQMGVAALSWILRAALALYFG